MTDSLNIPGLSDDENATVNRLLCHLETRATRNLIRTSYYDGKRALRQFSAVVPPQYFNLCIVLGWSATAVDMLAQRCNLDAFVWPDGDLNSLGYRQVWDDNYLSAESNSAITSSLIHGVSFLVNTKGDAAAGEPESLIHVKDALSATGDWNPRTRRLDNLLSIISRDPNDRSITSFALYLHNLTITASRDIGAAWTVDRSEHTWGVPAEMLVYKPRAGRPFGYSRISRPVMSLHDSAVRTMIRAEGHADVFSFPEMWVLGADESVFSNQDGSPISRWEVMLGRLKVIPDDEDQDTPRRDVKQFSAASPQPHIDMMKHQAQQFAGETSIPLTSLGISDMSNPTSSDSYIASREDLISLAETATDDWAPAFRRAMTRALAIASNEDSVPEAWSTIDTKWRSPIYLSKAQQADAGLKQITAVPWLAETEVGLELLGLDEQQIRRAMADKRRAQVSSLLQRLPALNAPQTAALDANGQVSNGSITG